MIADQHPRPNDDGPGWWPWMAIHDQRHHPRPEKSEQIVSVGPHVVDVPDEGGIEGGKVRTEVNATGPLFHAGRPGESLRNGWLAGARQYNRRPKIQPPRWPAWGSSTAPRRRRRDGSWRGWSPGGRVAIDIETAPNKTEIERLAKLLQTKAETAGVLKARRKLKAPADEIAALVADGKRLAAEIRYARTAGLDPQARPHPAPAGL